MKKIIKLSESDLVNIIDRVISEQKRENRTQSSFAPTQLNNKNQSQNKPISKDTKTSKNFCPALPSYNNVDMFKVVKYQSTAGELISKGVPTRSTCEVSYVSIRPKFSNKNFFVVDTRHNTIYLFNKEGKFVGKSYIIDGYNAQSQDAKKMAEALLSWNENVSGAGFKYDNKLGKYKDKTGRPYNSDLIYDYIDKNKTRFFPKGIYSINKLAGDENYIGGPNNVFNITTLDGSKNLANAIHGFYNEPPRVKAMLELKKAMGKSASPTSMSIPDSFIKTVEQYMSTSKFNQSYGCINIPEDFLKIARPYAAGALIFVIGETEDNYLVQSDNFFKSMGQSEQCPNVASLGQILPKIEAAV